MLEVTFTGEFDSIDPTIVHYVGVVEGYGEVTLDFNTQTGAWTAHTPVGFPAGVEIRATWQDLDPDVIRAEPGVGSQTSAGWPESTISGTTGVGGTVDFEVFDDMPWRRPMAGEGERRAMENLVLYSGSKALVVIRQPTILDQANVPWTLKPGLDGGTSPTPVELEEATTYSDTCYSVTSNGLSLVGAVNGVVVSDPTAFNSPAFSQALWEWWPFNEHPYSDLAVEEKRWKTSVPLFSLIQPVSYYQNLDPAVDMVFVLDESGSMTDSWAYVYPLISNLNAQLLALGIGAGPSYNRYGLVCQGIWTDIPHPSYHELPTMFGAAYNSLLSGDYWATVNPNSPTEGLNQLEIASSHIGHSEPPPGGPLIPWAAEDAYAGIDHAINFTRGHRVWRTSAAKVLLVMTDEGRNFAIYTNGEDALQDRDLQVNLDTTQQRNNLLAELADWGGSIHIASSYVIIDSGGVSVLGQDSTGKTYAAAGANFTTGTGGTWYYDGYEGDLTIPSTTPPTSMKADYYDLALASGGTAWNYSLFRSGGDTQLAFTKALVAALKDSILGQLTEVEGSATYLKADDRTLVQDWGWMLHFAKGKEITLPLHQAVPAGAFSLSFRFQPQISLVEDTETELLTLGPLAIKLLNTSGLELSVCCNTLEMGSVAVLAGHSYYFALAFDGSVITRVRLFEHDAPDNTPTWSDGPYAEELTLEGTESLVIASQATTFLLGDIRLWTAEKTAAEFVSLRRPEVRAFPQARWPSTVVGRQGQLLTLFSWPDSSWVYLSTAPAGSGTLPGYSLEVETASMVMTDVRITDDPRLLNLGLDGGQAIAQPWRLGQQFHPVLADGRTLFSTTTGVIGTNQEWLVAGTLTPEAYRNVSQHSIFTTSTGESWKVAVAGSLTGPVLVVEEANLGGTSNPMIDGGGYELVVVNGTLQRGDHVGLFPTMFLYSPSTELEIVAGTADWVDPNDFGLGLGVAALEGRGKLSFYVDAGLDAGPHRLVIDAGNIGEVEAGFEGHHVELNIGQALSTPAWLTGEGKVSPRGLTTVDFDLPTSLSPGWVLEISWRGKLSAPQRHLSYALAVYGFTLSRRVPTLYRVDSPTVLTQVSPPSGELAAIPGTTPGGWVGLLGPAGSIHGWLHESDELLRQLHGACLASIPSEVTTGVSLRRDEDILLNDSTWTEADPSAPASPSISTFSTPHLANEGDDIVYTATGVANCVSLIWEFWDGEVRVTEPTVLTQTKRLTQGGVITSRLTGVSATGDLYVKTDTFTANHAPVISAVETSLNDAIAPYEPVVEVSVQDLDSNSGSYPSTKIFGTLDGEVDIVTSLVGGTLNGLLTFSPTITFDVTHTLHVRDDLGANRELRLSFRTQEARPLVVSVTSMTKNPTKGTVTMVAVATDLDGDTISSFTWHFTRANGWAADRTDSGVTTPMTGGSWQNVVFVNMSGESPGAATVVVDVVTTSGKTGQATTQITIEPNYPPVLQYFGARPETIVPGQECQFMAFAEDPNGDVLTFDWAFDDPAGVVRKGNPVYITPSTNVVKGTLLMTDVVGDTTVAIIPPVVITSAAVVYGTVGRPFTYIPKAMGDPAPTWVVNPIPSGLTYINGTVVGYPGITGVGTLGLVATNTYGSDTRQVYVSVQASAGNIPSPPTNLQVKGSFYPTYHSGEDISVTWTGDGLSKTVLRFYTLTSSLFLTATLSAGVESFLLANAEFIEAIGTEQPFVIHAYSKLDLNESLTFVEIGVDYSS